MTETYSYINDFSSDLIESDLLNKININSTINKDCSKIERVDDDVNIYFTSSISDTERTELNSLISGYTPTINNDTIINNDVRANNFYFNDYTNRTCFLSISNKSISSKTDTLLTNWTVDLSSDFVDINPVTGVFYPKTGYYSMIYNALIKTNSSSTKIGARLVDGDNKTVYSSVVVTDDLFSSETGNEGAQYEILSFFFNSGTSYKLHVKIDSNETMDFLVKICKTF
jgi:hypothetical protein